MFRRPPIQVLADPHIPQMSINFLNTARQPIGGRLRRAGVVLLIVVLIYFIFIFNLNLGRLPKWIKSDDISVFDMVKSLYWPLYVYGALSRSAGSSVPTYTFVSQSVFWAPYMAMWTVNLWGLGPHSRCGALSMTCLLLSRCEGGPMCLNGQWICGFWGTGRYSLACG